MKRLKKFPQKALDRSIEAAKLLVEGHRDPNVPAGERLREIGKKLNVSRIEPGAVRTAGFLKRLADRSFAIYYANDCSLARRRFTVAHELAHLILERHHKHIGKEDQEIRYHQMLERAVDRIAAEILMPESLVIEALKSECQRRRAKGISIPKRLVIQEVGNTLGVSERALVHRLLELRELLCVLLRFQWYDIRGPEQARYDPIVHSFHAKLGFDGTAYPDPGNLELEDGWEHCISVKTLLGPRVIRCNAWRRQADRPEDGNVSTWIFGWAWNSWPPPPWDDSHQS